MKWDNVKLILARELKDQIRDRRTLFTVLVLPLLLYPLMGIAMLQISQFTQQHPIKIWMVGVENLPESPALLIDGEFNPALVNASAKNITLDVDKSENQILAFIKKVRESNEFEHGERVLNDVLQSELENRNADLAVFFPEPIEINSSDSVSGKAEMPAIIIFQNSARDESKIAAQEFNEVVIRWRQTITKRILSEKKVDTQSLNTFVAVHNDVADEQWKQAATWSKILPFIVMIWSLTGAFYPAVDLCAGEKERGTFETLLSSPAKRSEIAIGKLLTVIFFSMTTSFLNLISMAFTGMFVITRLGQQMPGGAIQASLGLPPLSSILWLLLALLPISALFSAVALAAASFAKSSKEGQYYLVPLMMISMPLMMLPMMPAAKLDLGSSLIPVSGLMLMLRGLIEGQYSEVARYAGPVVAVTLICCWLAVRWVVVQFSSESVIFRPSERFSVGVWLKNAVAERHDLPLVGHALLCGVLILVIKFFMSLGASVPDSWMAFSKQTVIVLIASVAVPAVLMAMFLTRRPTKTLRLKTCRVPVACGAVLLAICLHPCVMWLTNLVMYLYPISADLSVMEQVMGAIMADAPGFFAIILVLALAPAVFEEIAFRGFILSGLQSRGNAFSAILISSLLFGMAHSILQQSIITFFLGCLLGMIAIRTGSLIPCVLYHFTHNSISTAMSMITAESMARFPLLKLLLVKSESGGYEYSTLSAVAMAVAAAGLIGWFWALGKEDKSSQVAEQVNNHKSDLRLGFEAFVAKISAK